MSIVRLQSAHVWCRFDHDIKGQGIYAYVSLHDGHELSDAIRKDLIKTVREQIGAFAAPDVIHWAPGERPCLPPLLRGCAVSMCCTDFFIRHPL